MLCKEVGCGGEVGLSRPVMLRVGCASFAFVRPCSKCGRLHWPHGEAILNRQEHRAFFLDRQIVHKDEGGNIIQY